MITYPAWLVPLLLSLGVICAAVAILGVRRFGTARGWAVATLVFGAVAAALVLVAALQ